jgi:hypothetical protein
MPALHGSLATRGGRSSVALGSTERDSSKSEISEPRIRIRNTKKNAECRVQNAELTSDFCILHSFLCPGFEFYLGIREHPKSRDRTYLCLSFVSFVLFVAPGKKAEAEREVRSPSVRHSGFVIRVCLTLILTLTLTLTLTTPRNDDHVAGYWHRPLFRQNNLVCGVQRL